MTLRQRWLRGTALNLVAMASNQGSTFVAGIIAARLLRKEAFGEYAMVYTTLLAAVTLSQWATGYTSAKYVAEFRTSDPERAGRILGACAAVAAVLAGAGALALAAAAPWLAGGVLRSSALVLPLTAGAVYLFFSAVNGYQTGALLGLEAFRGLALAGLASGAASIAAVALGAWKAGVLGAVAGLGLGALVRCALHRAWLDREVRKQGIRPVWRGSLRKEKDVFLKFALPAALAGYYSMPMVWLANSFLARLPGGYGAMGLFTAANNLRLLVLFLPNIMNGVTLAILNNEKGTGDAGRYERVFKLNVLAISLATLGCAAAVGLAGRPILLLSGREFGEGRLLLWILLGAAVFEGLSLSLYQYVQSQARIWTSFLAISVPRDMALVLAAYVLVPRHLGTGLAAAYLGSCVLSAVLHLGLVARLRRRSALTAYASQVY